MSLCIVVPAFNESGTIISCLRSLRETFPEATLLVVDNASTDGTAVQARAAGATVLHESRAGKGFAVATGVAWALQQGFPWIALHDADNEYAPQGLHDLITRCQAKGTAPPVMGVGLREVSLGKVLWRSLVANWLARRALQWALRKPAPLDILTGARVFNAACAQLLFEQPGALKGFELETALTRRAMQEGATLVFAPVRYTPRAAIQKKIRAGDLWPILKAAFGR